MTTKPVKNVRITKSGKVEKAPPKKQSVSKRIAARKSTKVRVKRRAA